MGQSKQHHFVPRWYLEQFVDEAGFLHVFDSHGTTWRRQRPKEVMRIGKYYRQDWAPDGVDPNALEIGLGATLEPAARAAIGRLLTSSGLMTDDDLASLLVYLEFQRVRVPRQAEFLKQQLREFILHAAPPEAVAEIESGKFTLTIKDSARFDFMKMFVGKLSPWFSNMIWEVIEAEGNAAFLTTDSPVSFLNPAMPPPCEGGLGLAGTVVLFPLTSRHLLLMRHREYSTATVGAALRQLPKPTRGDGHIQVRYGTTWRADKVISHNKNMIALADNLAVAKSKAVLETSVSAKRP